MSSSTLKQLTMFKKRIQTGILMFIRNNLFVFLLIFRSLNSFLTLSLFEPDEIFQSIEPIAQMLRNKTALTWDFAYSIRSITFPLLHFPLLYIAYLLESNFLAAIAVKMTNAIISALTDYFTVCAGGLLGTDCVLYCVFSHGLWLYSPRSHINSFEAFLGTMAFYYILMFKNSKRSFYFFVFVLTTSFGAYLRPSILVLLFFPFINTMFYTRKMSVLLLAPVGLLVILILSIVDSVYYGNLVFVPWNFFKFNVFLNGSSYFGIQHCLSHFVFFAILTGPLMIPFFYNFLRMPIPGFCVAFYVFFYSALGHKEMRFLIPVIPFVVIVASKRKILANIFFLMPLMVCVLISLFYQNIFSPVFLLQGRISSNNKEDIRIFACTNPYLIPSYPFVADRRVSIKMLNGNPVLSNDIKKAFGYPKNVVEDEHAIFMKDLDVNFGKCLNNYDYFVMMETQYKEVGCLMDGFSVIGRFRYWSFYIDDMILVVERNQ